MKYYWIFAFLLLNLVTCVVNESYYSIIAPGTLKSNRRYSVVVALYDATEPATIQVSIDGPSYRKSEQLTISAGETKQVNFMPPKLQSGNYSLRAEGLAGIRFKNESILYIDKEAGPKIYIQQDKALYKPLDLVQFRVLILNEHTRPENISEPIRVEILDANGNRVKQFNDITLVKGVFTEKLQLAEHPALGVWKIVVIIGGKYDYSRHKTFKVMKYVLPKFSVNIKTPENFILDDRVIKAIIYGKYTFDKYVEGNVTVFLDDARLGTEFGRKQLSIDGMGSVEFKLDDPAKYSGVDAFFMRAFMTEKQTGITQSATAEIKVRRQQYNVDILINDIEYRGNKPYRLKAKVKYWNDVPVLDTKTPVYMEHANQTYETHLDAEGIATFEFDYNPISDYKVRYKDSSTMLGNIFADRVDRKESPLRLKLMGGRLRLGKMIEVEVSSDTDIPYIIYMLTSHSNIVHTEYIKMPANQKSYIIQIKPSIELIPWSYLYVHYIQNGNLRYKEMKFDFPYEFENQISVMAPKEAAPGSEVTINLRAQPKSYVCILAVDLSVYLLDPSYDLDKFEIINGLLGDISRTPIRSTEYPGLLSGLITLTNSHYPFETQFNSVIPYSLGGALPPPRTKFPETWIFKNLEITKDDTQLTLTIPDTITTWRITAFSIHDVTGFGIVAGPTNIITIQPFFVNLNLPYSVKRGEVLSLPVTVFNYHNQSLDAEITMYSNDQEFDFVDPSKSPSKRDTSDQKQQVKMVKVPSDGVESVSFMIKPKVVGDITLNVTGTTQLSSDAVVQKLKVEPEGAARNGNKAMLLKIATSEPNGATLKANIPENIVPDSEFLTLSIGGDTLAPTMKNLNGLVMRPTGCGEQNMVNFVPNILVLQYLKSVGRLKTEKKLATQALRFIEIGYQQELSFRHNSGGYSPFGERIDKGDASTWLTAYVIRFFIKAAKFISVEESIIVSGLDYLSKNQLESGEFVYTGHLFYPAQQNRFGFTAFVLLTFLEDEKYSNKYKDVIENGLKFLHNNMDKTRDIYALSIMAGTLQKANHANAKKVLDKVQAQRKEHDGLHWWSADDKNNGKDVEITAYIMMALLETPAEYIGILKWLTEQRNGNGGFKSTQDTVVGLQALVKYSEKFNNPNALKMNLKYTALNELGDVLKTDEFSLDANNSLVLQMHMLPRSTRSISFNATGSGVPTLQLSSKYHVAIGEPMQHFVIEPKSNLITTNSMSLDICFTYKATITTTSKNQTDADNTPEIYSNMVILEVNLPTGFRSDAEFSLELLDNELVQRIESKNSESLIVIYLDNLLAGKRNCLNIDADKTHDAMNLKPVPVVMYDYYNTTCTNTMFYTIEDKGLPTFIVNDNNVYEDKERKAVKKMSERKKEASKRKWRA